MKHEHCSELLGNLAPYLDGEASKALCAEIEHHLEDCENCRVVVNTLCKTVELVRDLPQPDLPEGALDRLYISLDLADHLGSRLE
jgi:predicted anti-sigma-YlaC factor YlaD